ncbi:ABC transporter ATP-binding protein [Aquabacter cavernae]|uniref:ABC transporter ATP-binding protein n=1 Tax=Aquabacter cavernae TaxID=2496029 RepID=UPI000F8CFC6B|nr:ABC transporter ATP-binding protein [Aquabacter cavernae]
MLEVTDLATAYDGITALRGVTLRVPTGSMVAIVGPNGAGKSTLLNTISGVLRPHAGTVRFDGADVTRLPAHKVARLGLLQVPEGRQILGPLSVEENLLLGRLARGARAADGTADDLDAVFSLFPILAERRRQEGGSLSGGQQQMLAIGRALMGRPRLLMLDEPSLGLSPIMARQVFDALATLKARGQTILLVEQNARRALASTDFAYVLEQGRIVQEGPSAALASDPRIISHYLPETDLSTS